MPQFDLESTVWILWILHLPMGFHGLILSKTGMFFFFKLELAILVFKHYLYNNIISWKLSCNIPLYFVYY